MKTMRGFFYFLAPKSLQMVTAAMKLKDACSFDPRQHTKKQRHYFVHKGPYSQTYGFTSSNVWMWEFDHKESWAPKNWCFWTMVLKTLESPLDCKEIKPVNPKGNQIWIFNGRSDAEAEVPILWPPGAKNWLNWKDPDAGKIWRQEEKGMTEEEMVGWHHQLDGHEFEQASGVSDRNGNLACCSPWGLKALHTTEQLNWTELKADFGHFGPCVFSRLTTTSEELGLFALEGIRNKWLPFDTPKPISFGEFPYLKVKDARENRN